MGLNGNRQRRRCFEVSLAPTNHSKWIDCINAAPSSTNLPQIVKHHSSCPCRFLLFNRASPGLSRVQLNTPVITRGSKTMYMLFAIPRAPKAIDLYLSDNSVQSDRPVVSLKIGDILTQKGLAVHREAGINPAPTSSPPPTIHVATPLIVYQ